MIILDQDAGVMGSFKVSLWKAALKLTKSAMKANELEVKAGRLYHNGKQIEKALILSPSKDPKPTKLIALAAFGYPLINPPRSSLLSKPEYQVICRAAKVPTPDWFIGTKEGDVITKPPYGQEGIGIKLGRHGPYTQRFISNHFTDRGVGFDIRLHMLLGRAIGGIMRINTGDIRSNAHEGGKCVTFWYEQDNVLLKPQIEAVYKKIVGWLGYREPQKEWELWGQRIYQATGLGYFAFDMVFDADRHPYVVDINPGAAQDAGDRALVRIKRALIQLREAGYIEDAAKFTLESVKQAIKA